MLIGTLIGTATLTAIGVPTLMILVGWGSFLLALSIRHDGPQCSCNKCNAHRERQPEE